MRDGQADPGAAIRSRPKLDGVERRMNAAGKRCGWRSEARRSGARRSGTWRSWLAAAVMAACSGTGQAAETLELQHGLAEQLADTRVEVAWVNGFHHLQVTLDGPRFRTLADSEYRPVADSIARVAAGYFPRTRSLDSITVTFVVGSSGTLLHTRLLVGTTFATSELRSPP
jgi:hypothetical protein